MNDSDVPLDSVHVHSMLGDSMKVTARGGDVTFEVHAGAMFLVRITKHGYEPLVTRLPNQVLGVSSQTVRLLESRQER